MKLTPIRKIILRYLAARQDGIASTAEIGAHTNKRLQHVHPIMRGLEREGAIRNDAPNGRGRRAAWAITDAGHRAIQEAT